MKVWAIFLLEISTSISTLVEVEIFPKKIAIFWCISPTSLRFGPLVILALLKRFLGSRGWFHIISCVRINGLNECCKKTVQKKPDFKMFLDRMRVPRKFWLKKNVFFEHFYPTSQPFGSLVFGRVAKRSFLTQNTNEMTNGPNRGLVGKMHESLSYFFARNFYLDFDLGRGRNFP